MAGLQTPFCSWYCQAVPAKSLKPEGNKLEWSGRQKGLSRLWQAGGLGSRRSLLVGLLLRAFAPKTLLEREREKSEVLCFHSCGKWKVMPGLPELRKSSCVGRQAFPFWCWNGCRAGEVWLGESWGQRGGSALGAHPIPFLAGSVDLPVSPFRWLLPTDSLPRARKLFIPWLVLQTLGLVFKWLIPVRLPGRSSKHPCEPKGRAVQC